MSVPPARDALGGSPSARRDCHISFSEITLAMLLRALVVDDSVAVRDRLVTLLSEVAGVDVVGTAGDVDGAVAADGRLAPDVVVLDIRMPGGDGVAVLKAVKARSPATAVIMLTNYAAEGHRTRCLAAGADSFFDKSTDLDRLLELVEELVGRHSKGEVGGSSEAVA